MSREGAGTPLVAEVIKGECGGRGARLARAPPRHPLLRGPQAVPGVREAPGAGQGVPLNFRARIDAVS